MWVLLNRTREGRNKKWNKNNGGGGRKEEEKGKAEKSPDKPPMGYIQVRARRGQAIDSHSLTEMVQNKKQHTMNLPKYPNEFSCLVSPYKCFNKWFWISGKKREDK